jgi:hypothetical protein
MKKEDLNSLETVQGAILDLSDKVHFIGVSLLALGCSSDIELVEEKFDLNPFCCGAGCILNEIRGDLLDIQEAVSDLRCQPEKKSKKCK